MRESQEIDPVNKEEDALEIFTYELTTRFTKQPVKAKTFRLEILS